ncbi:MAG: ABC transporter permease [Candidatus Margulisbacteria bacterium]|jgi:sulfonate transport system permease protein|nr:ABC transporter permease [Candidatus Margulisiibacteriota bacterium]
MSASLKQTKNFWRDPYSYFLPGGILLLWLIVTEFKLVEPRLVPSIGSVADALWELFRTGVRIDFSTNLGLAIGLSISRVFRGFVLGNILGFLFGSALGLSSKAERLFLPLFHAARQVPFVGWIPLIIIWCGTGEGGRITFITLGAFTPMALNTYAGIAGVPKQYLELGQVYRLSLWQLFCRIILPAALPSILTGVVLSFNMSWILLIAAEIMISTQVGLGALISDAREIFYMDVVFAGVFLIVVITLSLNYLIEIGQQKLLGRFKKEGTRGGY